MVTHNTAVMSWTATVRKANSFSRKLSGQNANIPLGNNPKICRETHLSVKLFVSKSELVVKICIPGELKPR